MRTITVTAPAKVNLHLAVGGLTPDGYHAVDTVLHTLELHDTLHISEADALVFACDLDLGIAPSDNLVWRAAQSMGEEFGRAPRFALDLEKRIPHGAGLGGGSSDAAATLAGIAHLWGIDAASDRVRALAARLGADVPFFLSGACAHMGGRGDLVRENLSALDASVVIVKPHAPVSTAAAYRALDAASRNPGSSEAIVRALRMADCAGVAQLLHNDFEEVSSALVPAISEVLLWLREQPAVTAALLAGSGSACFALVDTSEKARTISLEAESRGWWSASTKFSARGIAVSEGSDA